MLIEYVTTKHRRLVSDAIGGLLVCRKIAREVYQTAVMKAEEPQAETVKPKRRYKRRDMKAKD